MPPKKRTSQARTARSKPTAESGQTKKVEDAGDAKATESTEDNVDIEAKSKAPNKRKNQAEDKEPQKAERRSGRGTTKSQPSQLQLLKYMLSSAAEELCRPEDEAEDISTRGEIRTYSGSVMNPYEELLCAIVLSRPISHRLGLRTIRTILNAPYDFTSARATRDAGSEKQHQALWDARTQHKDKTATQIGELADVVLEKFTAEDDAEGTQLQRVRDDCDREVPKERQYLKKSIKGLGETGLDIFFRRVQWLWDAGYPFVDGKSVESLRKLDLPKDGRELHALIEQNWSELETQELAGEDEATKKRRAMVIILERATGSDLEGKHEALLEAATA
ncbi:hypothetical protein LTR62_003557 [Meristemomyces frigidus]|uniref:HhH-GPD domain-containing protein n=1 Tax=Meristemomyces frigidus TaxID=1508187 RepID=A0AAN7TP39_9PEZI|nr:hypothetical protein LTR62_003557 [Meristemomyces frigidus]